MVTTCLGKLPIFLKEDNTKKPCLFCLLYFLTNQAKCYYPDHYDARQSRKPNANMPQEIDTRKRKFLKRTGEAIAAGITIAALSQAEQAYAAVEKLAGFRNRRKPVNSVISPFLDTQATTQSVSQRHPVTIQDTPTPDATVTALQKRILQDQAKQLETPPQNWLESNIATLIGFAGTAGTISVGIWQFNKNFRSDREKQAHQQAIDAASRNEQEQARILLEKNRQEDLKIEQKKRDEDRFFSVVAALGSPDAITRTGAAIMLRTFLDPKQKESYKRFYQQIFDLTVANLRLREINPDNPRPDSLDQALIRVFKDVVPLVIERLREGDEGEKIDLKSLLESPPRIALGRLVDPNAVATFRETQRKFLDASGVRLDGANLSGSDLRYIVLQNASLNKANLYEAHLDGATLDEASLNEVNLNGAQLTHTRLRKAVLNKAKLSDANLYGAILIGATLNEAKLPRANIRQANLNDAHLNDADLEDANLSGADLYGVHLKGANLKMANLKSAVLYGVSFREEGLYERDTKSAGFYEADLREANLESANLTEARLVHANLTGAKLTLATFNGADLSQANLSETNLFGANPESADRLEGTCMYNVKNYDGPLKIQQCKDKGADFKEPPQSGPINT